MNYPNNFLLKNSKIINRKNKYFYVFKLENSLWEIVDVKKIAFGEFFEFKRSNLDIKDDQMTVIVPSHERNIDNYLYKLPTPLSFRVDDSPIDERGSYNFIYCDSTASYQGEYPYFMASLNRSSFFSFDSLRLDNNTDSLCYSILMNLNINSKVASKHNIKVFKSENLEVLESLEIKTNSCKAFLLKKNSDKFLSSIKPIFFSCNTASFIPLFLSLKISNDKKELNVEHSHPPSEFFWGPSKNIAVRDLKNKWIL